MKNNNKILIIQSAFIGDVVLTTPLIEVLRKKYPDAEIDFLTVPSSENIVDSNPNLRKIIIYDKNGLVKFGDQLATEKYHICITPHRSIRSAFLSKRSGAAIRIGFDRTAWGRAYTHLVSYRDDLHEIERNLSLLTALGIKNHLIPPVIYSTDQDEKRIDVLQKELGIDESDRLFTVAPGSVWPTKRWPEDHYTSLCGIIEKKGFQVILVGSKEDKPLCTRIEGKNTNTLSTAGLLTLRQTFSLLKRSYGVLTNDSAPLHIGMAADIPVFAIFGASSPAFGFGPFGEKSMVIEDNDLSCRPCGVHGSKKCPTKTFDCMELLKPEDVAQKIIDSL